MFLSIVVTLAVITIVAFVYAIRAEHEDEE